MSKTILPKITILTFFLLFTLPNTICSAGETEFNLLLHPKMNSKTAFSGRLYLLLERDPYVLPMDRSRPSNTSPWFSKNIQSWKSNTSLKIDSGLLGYPYSLENLPEGPYLAQAVFDINEHEPGFSNQEGNLFSRPIAIYVNNEENCVFNFTLDQTTQDRPLKETPFLSSMILKSRILTVFNGYPTYLKAAVHLPAGYYSDARDDYPIIFLLPGFGTTYDKAFDDNFQRKRYGISSHGKDIVFVFLDQTCRLGNHVWTDSENNGPWGRAFIEELIPHIGKIYRVSRDPEKRFLLGQSSGAWAGLWLHINYPNEFGGVWALSPDPIDFTSILGVNIYSEKSNLYQPSNPREIQRNIQLSKIDQLFGSGWALSTFEAVFSPRNENGEPQKLWNRTTGEIDAEVARFWAKYDIHRIIKKSWTQLLPTIKDKIHIYVADDDPFGLDVPVQMLQETIKNRDLDGIEATVLPRGGHDLWSDEIREEIYAVIDSKIEE
ncbi:MAG: alpha/beta hydrolase-fold protein [Acidobacteriota bacterium]